MGKLLKKLARRKVFKIVAVYGVVAWVLIQVTDFIIDGQSNVEDSWEGLTFQSVNKLSMAPMGHFSAPVREDGGLYFGGIAGSSSERPITTPLSNSRLGLVELWEAGQTAFGQYVTGVPFTVATGRELAANPLLDYAFLNLEQDYNINSALDLAQGLRSGAEGAAMELLVRIPPLSEDGVETSRTRVKELLAMGADGVVFPHVRSVEEARMAVSFFEGVNVWSPANPDGDIIVMLMLETPDVFADLEEIANIPHYSALACGIGSLTNALGGDREAAEKMNLEVLAHSQRLGMADMITANTESVARRVNQGFLGLLVYGPTANEVIRLGRAAAGR